MLNTPSPPIHRKTATRCLALLAALALASQAKESLPPGPLIPKLDGPWIQLAGQPPLEKWSSPAAEPVDFTVFQADDGRWQLIACIRKTTHPGSGRLLYRWSSDELTKENWKPEGIFLSSRADWNHAEGHLQAPFHVKDGGKHHLFYNSRGAHLLTSANGIDFEPYGKEAVFPMGRDVCLLDDRKASGKWIAYYTSPEKGINPATNDHTIRARTAPELTGPWSESAVEIPPIMPPPPGYAFVYPESPLVIKRGDHYYRFEQLFVFRSKDPLRWEGPPIADLAPRDPLKRLAPEIATHHGRTTSSPTNGAAKIREASTSPRWRGRKATERAPPIAPPLETFAATRTAEPPRPNPRASATEGRDSNRAR